MTCFIIWTGYNVALNEIPIKHFCDFLLQQQYMVDVKAYYRTQCTTINRIWSWSVHHCYIVLLVFKVLNRHQDDVIFSPTLFILKDNNS